MMKPNKGIPCIDASEVKQLMRVFTHDLRNPLVNMKALVADLKQQMDAVKAGDLAPINGGMPEAIELLDRSVARLNAMVQGAGEIGRCLSDAPEYEPVVLDDVVARLVARSSVDAGVCFHIGKLPDVWADALAMNRVLDALISNAVAATHAGSITIEACVQKDRHWHTFYVRDSGSGIASCDIKHIFEPFYSVGGDSPGLGLAIARALVQAHGGSIWCESNAGAGATFFVRLPAGSDSNC